MPLNLGPADRAIRALVGLALLALVFFGPKSVWGYVGLLPLVTASAGYCPLYQLLGISTCRRGPHSPASPQPHA